MSMSRPFIPSLCAALCVALATAAPAARAQQSTASALSSDRELARAQRLVSSGEGIRGRALVDSVIEVTPPDSPRFPEALFTRATLAATAAAAERDYRRIFIEYPLSLRAPEAIMRLAQLEIARGDRAQAAEHLERLTREHPGSPAIPRANYWLARVRFEQGNTAGGCEALSSARSGVSSTDVELRNQIEYYASRCLDVRTAAAPAAPARPPGPGGAGRRPVADTVPTRTSQSAPPSRAAAADTATRSAPRGSAPTATSAAGAPATTGAVAASTPAGSEEVSYSVQVAAYSDQASAERLVTKLLDRGYVARVDGDAAPFRVRIGRFETWAAAAGTARKLKAQRIDGFVVETQPR
jgi:cell division septation protein DedD